MVLDLYMTSCLTTTSRLYIMNDLQQQTKVAKSEKTFLESTFS